MWGGGVPCSYFPTRQRLSLKKVLGPPSITLAAGCSHIRRQRRVASGRMENPLSITFGERRFRERYKCFSTHRYNLLRIGFNPAHQQSPVGVWGQMDDIIRVDVGHILHILDRAIGSQIMRETDSPAD